MKKTILFTLLLLAGCSKLPEEEKQLANKKVEECNTSYMRSLFLEAEREERIQNAKFLLFRAYGIVQMKYQEIIDMECEEEKSPVNTDSNDLMRKLSDIQRQLDKIEEKLDYIR